MTLRLTLALASLAVLVGAMAVLAWQFRDAPAHRRWMNLLLPGSQLAMAAYLFFYIVRYDLALWLAGAVAATCLVCGVGDLVLFRRLRVAEDADMAAERARLLEEQTAAQAAHRESVAVEARQARELREQMVEELDRADALLKQRSLAEVPAQLDRAVRLMQGSGVPFCEHRVVDALMVGKARACSEAGIRLETQLVLRDDMPLPDVELCAVFANVMDNALRACEHVAPADRFITLKAREAGGYFLLDAENSCAAETPSPQRPSIAASGRSSKLPEHGWGLSILKSIADSHQGVLETHQSDFTYQTSISLKLS